MNRALTLVTNQKGWLLFRKSLIKGLIKFSATIREKREAPRMSPDRSLLATIQWHSYAEGRVSVRAD